MSDNRDMLDGTLLGDLLALVESCSSDYLKAKNGVKAAGTRVRTKMLKVRDLVIPVRKEMLVLRQKSDN